MKRILLTLIVVGIAIISSLFIYGRTRVRTQKSSMDKLYIGSSLQDEAMLQEYLTQRWKEFKTLYGDQWQIRWNKETGFPEYLYGPGTGSWRGEADDVALLFISENRELLQIDPENLKVVEVIQHQTGKIFIVHFQQVYDGRHVEGGRVVVDVNNERGVTVLESTYRHELDVIKIDSAPTIDKITALNIALANEGLSVSQAKKMLTDEGVNITHQITLVVHQKNGKSYPTWKVPLFRWIHYVDATTGEIVDRYSNIRY